MSHSQQNRSGEAYQSGRPRNYREPRNDGPSGQHPVLYYAPPSQTGYDSHGNWIGHGPQNYHGEDSHLTEDFAADQRSEPSAMAPQRLREGGRNNSGRRDHTTSRPKKLSPDAESFFPSGNQFSPEVPQLEFPRGGQVGGEFPGSQLSRPNGASLGSAYPDGSLPNGQPYYDAKGTYSGRIAYTHGVGHQERERIHLSYIPWEARGLLPNDVRRPVWASMYQTLDLTSHGAEHGLHQPGKKSPESEQAKKEREKQELIKIGWNEARAAEKKKEQQELARGFDELDDEKFIPIIKD
ncbi:Small glutamine-rich tetratricopeptide repeat-containing protein 2 [Hypoxylon texense]